MVVFLYRDDYYNEDSEDKGIAEIIIGKQRNGPTGTVALRWDPHTGRFLNNDGQHMGNTPPPESYEQEAEERGAPKNWAPGS